MVFREVTVKGIDASDYQTIQVWRSWSLSGDRKPDAQYYSHSSLSKAAELTQRTGAPAVSKHWAMCLRLCSSPCSFSPQSLWVLSVCLPT